MKSAFEKGIFENSREFLFVKCIINVQSDLDISHMEFQDQCFKLYGQTKQEFYNCGALEDKINELFSVLDRYRDKFALDSDQSLNYRTEHSFME